MLGYGYRKLTVPDVRFTRADKEIGVQLSIPSKLALLLETSLDELAAALASREKRVKTVGLMFRHFLTGSDHVEYFVVISLKAAVGYTTALRLAKEVNRWKTETPRTLADRCAKDLSKL
jgi:hypothetical protein